MVDTARFTKVSPSGFELLGYIAANLNKLSEIDLAHIQGIVDGMVYKEEQKRKEAS